MEIKYEYIEIKAKEYIELKLNSILLEKIINICIDETFDLIKIKKIEDLLKIR